jgi:hypothetical protein
MDGGAFVQAARAARALIADPTVAAAWERPSVLPGFTVGGLAAHLGSQVVMAAGYATATAPAPDGPMIPAVEHYARATWVQADRDAPVNVAIRDRGEELAVEGPQALVAAVDDALAVLDDAAPLLPRDRPVPTPAGAWSLPLGEALLTRAVEIAVHGDDLAASVDLPAPELPDAVITPVLHLLVVVAARRHGQPAVLRALTRAERAPDTITAFGPS